MTRDPWSDAHQAATQDVLDPDLAAVRRRLWLRRALGLVLEGVAVLAAVTVVQRLISPEADEPWRAAFRLRVAGYVLLGVGVVLWLIGNVRTTGAGRTFVVPADLLTRTDRAWLRAQVEEGRPVPDERRAVVADAARRMVVEGRYLPADLGQAMLFVGGMIVLPVPSLLIAFSVFTVWLLVRVVRGAVWARRARRWLAQHA